MIMNGKVISDILKKNIKNKITLNKLNPSLVFIQVGEDKNSNRYINMKNKLCEEVGIYTTTHKLPQNISEKDLIENIESINNDSRIDAILINLPLPSHINKENVFNAISPSKDVDGVNPLNKGLLLSNKDCIIPCTPLGIMELFKAYDISLSGKVVCVIGNSSIVGKPIINLLINNDATVISINSKTKNLIDFTKNADIVISAAGKPNLVTANMVKDDVIIIDIGTNTLPDGSLVGDVDFHNIKEKSLLITPVPGGVGPMTVSMLLSNTVKLHIAHKINK